jgi:hypothetical protein
MKRCFIATRRSFTVLYCIVLYCIVLYLYLYLFSVQNIHDKDRELVNIQHTHNNKYIKFKVLNTIIKIKLEI